MKPKSLFKIAFIVAAIGSLLLTWRESRSQQITYLPLVNLLSTNGGFGTSANGTWTYPANTTCTTSVARVTKARDVTLYSYFDAVNTNAASSNIVFTAYVSLLDAPVTSGYWARATAYDWTNSFNGSSSVSNAISFTGLGGIGFIYWKAAYSGANIATNFTFAYSAKNGL